MTLLHLVREAAEKKILFLPHAVRQMSRPDRMIRVAEIRSCVTTGRMIEDYPEDARGHSCLMLSNSDDGRRIHVVCSPKADYLAIITAYEPDPAQWEADFATRRSE